MTAFFHVDRLLTLKPRQEIAAVSYDAIESLGLGLVYRFAREDELQSLATDLFPAGFTPFGHRYLLGAPGAVPPVERAIELIFEDVRRHRFPGLPSRFQSLHAFDSREMATAFRDQYGQGRGMIWEVQAEVAHRADMRLLTLETSGLGVIWNALTYWSGGPGSGNPFWEYLLAPPIRVLGPAA